MRTRHVMLLTTLLALALATASAAAGPEGSCQKSRYYAAAKYADCEQKALGKYFYSFPLYPAVASCQKKYANHWPFGGQSGTGSTCDNPRFKDNGDGTVTDRLTGLQWEKKTDDATIHDKDNHYSWTLSLDFSGAATGETFTTFLAALNSGGCFAGQCDWRLPTVEELQTILLAPYYNTVLYCTTSPCIDAVFGPTVPAYYWSGTTSVQSSGQAWAVNFWDGDLWKMDKNNDYIAYVRAVRGGL